MSIQLYDTILLISLSVNSAFFLLGLGVGYLVWRD